MIPKMLYTEPLAPQERYCSSWPNGWELRVGSIQARMQPVEGRKGTQLPMQADLPRHLARGCRGTSNANFNEDEQRYLNLKPSLVKQTNIYLEKRAFSEG